MISRTDERSREQMSMMLTSSFDITVCETEMYSAYRVRTNLFEIRTQILSYHPVP